MIGGLWTSDEDFDVRATTMMNSRKGFEEHGGRLYEDSSTDEEESKEAGAENLKNSGHLVRIPNAIKNNAQTKRKTHTSILHADTVAFDNSTTNVEAKNEDFSNGVHKFTKAPSIISFAEEADSEKDAASTLIHEQEDAETRKSGSRRSWDYIYNSSSMDPLISTRSHGAPAALSESKVTDEEERIWAPIGEMSRLIRFKRDGTIEVHVENRYGGQREQKQSHTPDAQLASRLANTRRSIEELEEDVDEPLRIIREQDEYQQKLLAKIRARLQVRRSPSMSDATESDGLQEKEAGGKESASEIKGTSRPRPSPVDLASRGAELASRSAEVAMVNKPQRAKEHVLLFADWLARADADADADADTNTDVNADTYKDTDTDSQIDANVDLDQKRGTKSSEDEEDKAMKRYEPEAEVEVLRAQVERLRAKLRARALELHARPFNNGETVDELLSDAQRFGLRALQRSRRASA